MELVEIWEDLVYCVFGDVDDLFIMSPENA